MNQLNLPWDDEILYYKANPDPFRIIYCNANWELAVQWNPDASAWPRFSRSSGTAFSTVSLADCILYHCLQSDAQNQVRYYLAHVLRDMMRVWSVEYCMRPDESAGFFSFSLMYLHTASWEPSPKLILQQVDYLMRVGVCYADTCDAAALQTLQCLEPAVFFQHARSYTPGQALRMAIAHGAAAGISMDGALWMSTDPLKSQTGSLFPNWVLEKQLASVAEGESSQDFLHFFYVAGQNNQQQARILLDTQHFVHQIKSSAWVVKADAESRTLYLPPQVNKPGFLEYSFWKHGTLFVALYLLEKPLSAQKIRQWSQFFDEVPLERREEQFCFVSPERIWPAVSQAIFGADAVPRLPLHQKETHVTLLQGEPWWLDWGTYGGLKTAGRGLGVYRMGSLNVGRTLRLFVSKAPFSKKAQFVFEVAQGAERSQLLYQSKYAVVKYVTPERSDLTGVPAWYCLRYFGAVQGKAVLWEYRQQWPMETHLQEGYRNFFEKWFALHVKKMPDYTVDGFLTELESLAGMCTAPTPTPLCTVDAVAQEALIRELTETAAGKAHKKSKKSKKKSSKFGKQLGSDTEYAEAYLSFDALFGEKIQLLAQSPGTETAGDWLLQRDGSGCTFLHYLIARYYETDDYRAYELLERHAAFCTPEVAALQDAEGFSIWHRAAVAPTPHVWRLLTRHTEGYSPAEWLAFSSGVVEPLWPHLVEHGTLEVLNWCITTCRVPCYVDLVNWMCQHARIDLAWIIFHLPHVQRYYPQEEGLGCFFVETVICLLSREEAVTVGMLEMLLSVFEPWLSAEQLAAPLLHAPAWANPALLALLQRSLESKQKQQECYTFPLLLSYYSEGSGARHTTGACRPPH